jgi:hypothetical protein
MRQFLYISTTKVDGLEAGLWRRRKPEVTLTASAPGVKLAVKTPTQAADLYRRTDALIRRMERRKHLVPVPEQGELGFSSTGTIRPGRTGCSPSRAISAWSRRTPGSSRTCSGGAGRTRSSCWPDRR